ncbi:MAG: glycosyltransferase family 39 protein [Oligoflexia bacterium]|nr:glycosyltransferase family 39 protein [Oligoflexia bacterium]
MRTAILALTALILTVLSLGLNFQESFVPARAPAELAEIRPDGWFEGRAALNFRRLAPRGNILELRLNRWRPAAAERPWIQVSVCGKALGMLPVGPDVARLAVDGDCEPREVALELPPKPADNLEAVDYAAHLAGARITSELGIPIVDLRTLGMYFALFFALALVLRYSAGSALAALLGMTIFALFTVRFHDSSALKTISFWMFFVSLALGFKVASLHKTHTISSLSVRRGIPDASPFWSICALLAVGIGGALRFYGLNFGLPANYHPDEVPKINAIMGMLARDELNPRYFLHPSLLLYSTMFLNKFLHAVGVFQGDFRESAFLAGRMVSALAGTASIGLLFLIGRLLFSPASGAMAAACLAVFPLHVTCSRYMKEDALLLCFVLCCLYFVIRAVERNSVRSLLCAGLVAGVAAGSKYSGALCMAFVMLAPWFKSGRIDPDFRFLKALIPALCLGLLGFACTTPYAFLDTPAFLQGIRTERSHMLKGHTETIDAWSQAWSYHFGRSLIGGMSPAALMIGVAGMGLLALRRRKEDLLVVFLILLFYLPAEWVKAKPAPQPERYILPCLPFLALAAAELCRAVAASRARLLGLPLFLAALLFPAYRSLALASEIVPDTRDLAASWMRANLPSGARIYLDWEPYVPRFDDKFFEVVNDPKKRIMPLLGVEQLRRSGVDYLVLSSLMYDRFFSQPGRKYALRRLYEQVFRKFPVVAEFAPRHGTYGFNNPVITVFALKPAEEPADSKGGGVFFQSEHGGFEGSGKSRSGAG